MRSVLRLLAFLTAACLASFGSVVTITFDSSYVGTYSAIPGPGGALLTYTGGNLLFDVVAAQPGPPIFYHAITSYLQNPDNPAPFRVDFALGTTYFQVGAGDYDQDVDPIYLWAYDSGGALLASDSAVIPADMYGGFYLTVNTNVPISYVLFTSGGQYPQSVYWDNLSYNAIPEPGSLWLMGSGLAGLAGFLRRRFV